MLLPVDLVKVFVAHRMIRREWRNSRASSVRPVPLVILIPAPTVGPHSSRTSRLAPMWWKKRPSRPITDSRLWLPASLNGSTDSAPWVSITSLEAGADLGQGVVPADRFERPSPLRPVRRSGVSTRSGLYDAVEETVDLGAQLALAERVVGVAAGS